MLATYLNISLQSAGFNFPNFVSITDELVQVKNITVANITFNMGP